jgi:hypothetical protein
VTVYTAPTSCSVTTYIKSPLRSHFGAAAASIRLGRPIDLSVAVTERDEEIRHFSVSAHVVRPTTSLRQRNERARDLKETVLRDTRSDEVPPDVARALAIREALRRETGTDPLKYVSVPAYAIHPKASSLPLSFKSSMVLRAQASDTVDGSYNVRVIDADTLDPVALSFVWDSAACMSLEHRLTAETPQRNGLDSETTISCAIDDLPIFAR